MDSAVIDRRALPGLAAGLAGLACGVGGVVLDVGTLAAAAGACALAAGTVAVVQVRRVRDVERDAAGRAALASLLDLPAGLRGDASQLIDPETGLADGRFFDLALDGRVAAARRRLSPVTVVLVDLRLAPECRAGRGRAEALAGFAELLRSTLREADVACRTGPTGFALVLEDTAEEGGVWAAERLQVAIAQDVSKVRRMAAGVASYPTHGLDADDVLTRAQAALTRACAAHVGRGLGHVEVAIPDVR